MTQQTILMNAHVETYLDHEDLKMIVGEIYREIEAECEVKALKELETSISNIMDICNCDRYRAMEHLMDAESVDYTSIYRDQDIEYFFWCQDIGLKNAFKYRDEYLQASPLPRLSFA